MALSLAMSLTITCAVAAQQPKPAAPEPRPAQRTGGPAASPATPVDPKRAQLKADSDLLAKAAAELKALLAKTNENTMSLEVIKKAEEVQRLAKQVQKDMKELQ